jgi:hypothetical protein
VTERDPRVVLQESIGLLALVATRRLYDEQPDLWRMGEDGRARTLEDFTHHLRALSSLSEDTFRRHVDYCLDLFARRNFPKQWLDDAWRTIAGVLRDEVPASAWEPAIEILGSVTGSAEL